MSAIMKSAVGCVAFAAATGLFVETVTKTATKTWNFVKTSGLLVVYLAKPEYAPQLIAGKRAPNRKELGEKAYMATKAAIGGWKDVAYFVGGTIGFMALHTLAVKFGAAPSINYLLSFSPVVLSFTNQLNPLAQKVFG